jgi:O-antigen ligase
MVGLTFAFATFALLSATWSEVPAYSAASAIGLVAYLVLACLAVLDLNEAVALRTIIWSLAAFLLVGLLAGLLGLEVAWLAPSAEENVSRLQGFSGHPNSYGQQAAIFITLAIIAGRAGILAKRTSAGLLLLGLVAILASGSRTNLAAALVAWLIIEVRNSPLRHVVVILGLTTAAALLFVAATGGLTEIDTVVRSFSRTGAEGEIFTLTGRTEIWAAAWELIVDKPLFGWGYNGIEDVIARTVGAGFEGTAVNAHNMLLQSLASLGFAGSLPAIAAVCLLCVRFLTRPDPARDQFALLLLIGGLGEVGIAATPILLTVVAFYFFARDDEQWSSARKRPEHT